MAEKLNTKAVRSVSVGLLCLNGGFRHHRMRIRATETKGADRTNTPLLGTLPGLALGRHFHLHLIPSDVRIGFCNLMCGGTNSFSSARTSFDQATDARRRLGGQCWFCRPDPDFVFLFRALP